MARPGDDGPAARRSGRRPGNSGTREAILAAAVRSFHERGYVATTIRGVAESAGVDAALVHHYFGAKSELFATVLALPANPASALREALEGPREQLGERIVRRFLSVWDAAETPPLLGLLSSAPDHEAAAALLREFIEREIVGAIAAALDSPDATVRASLAGAQIAGLGIARNIVRLQPLASLPAETVVAAVGPSVQRYLTGDVGLP